LTTGTFTTISQQIEVMEFALKRVRWEVRYSSRCGGGWLLLLLRLMMRFPWWLVTQCYFRRLRFYFCDAWEFYILLHTFGDESFQATTCTATDNSKQTGGNTPKTQNKHAL